MQWLSGRTGREIVQIPNPPLYNTLRIRFINCLGNLQGFNESRWEESVFVLS